MAFCPVCSRNSVFSERADIDDSRLGPRPATFYHCPCCGAFRMELAAEITARKLGEEQIRDLATWIRGQNHDHVIPLVLEGFVRNPAH